MEPYCNYDYYVDVYKGVEVPETDFESISIKASIMIKQRTFGRTDNTSGEANEAVKLCTCSLVDKIKEYNDIKSTSEQQANVKSETLGKWSRTFENKSSREIEKELKQEVDDIIKTYLLNYEDNNGTPLLYRGCYHV